MRAGSGRGMAGGVWDGADPADPGRIHPFPVAAAAERLHGGGGYLREEGIGGVSTRSEGGEGEEVKVDGEAATWGGGLQGAAAGSAAQIGRRGRASCSGDGDASESQAALGQAAARAGASGPDRPGRASAGLRADGGAGGRQGRRGGPRLARGAPAAAPSGGAGAGGAEMEVGGDSAAPEVGGGWRRVDFEEGGWLLPKMDGRLPFIGRG